MVPAIALDALTTTIHGLQHQLGDLATRMADVESRPPSSVQPLLPYGMLGYGGLPPLPPMALVPIIPEPITTNPLGER